MKMVSCQCQTGIKDGFINAWIKCQSPLTVVRLFRVQRGTSVAYVSFFSFFPFLFPGLPLLLGV